VDFGQLTTTLFIAAVSRLTATLIARCLVGHCVREEQLLFLGNGNICKKLLIVLLYFLTLLSDLLLLV
jgi:hypothetical protein